MRSITIIGLGLLLSACTTLTSEDPVQDETANTDPEFTSGPFFEETDPADTQIDCAADEYSRLIGQSIEEIHTDSLPRPRRIYSERDMVTLDYRPERLNIVTDVDGIVVNVKCG